MDYEEFISDFPIEQLTISPMNLRAVVNDEDHIRKLAESINTHGYSPDRALKVNKRNGDYRVVAGSNRLKAMQYLGRDTIPVYLFNALTDEEEAKLSEQDNQLDETHQPTHFLDKGEAFKRIAYKQQWTQEKIGQEYGCDQSLVARLIKLTDLPPTAQLIIKGDYDGISEDWHSRIPQGCHNDYDNWHKYFSEHLLRDVVKLERKCDQMKIILKVIESKGKLRGQKLKDECNKIEYKLGLKRQILAQLYDKKLSVIREIFRDIENGVYGDGKGESIKFEDSVLGNRIAALNEQAKCLFVCGDATDPVTWEKVNDKSIAVVITDPPYGIGYLTNRRIIKNDDIAQPIDNDQNVESAVETFAQVLDILPLKMQDDSHLYVFSSWKVYPEFESIISRHFKIKNVIVWDKQNRAAGDLEGNYGERHEFIIFATKGNRKLLGEKRPDNLMSFPKVVGNEQIVSTQKPVELIKTLLLQSTSEGELVCDPFAGSATLAVACQDRNPYFCVEKDEVVYKKALRRIQEQTSNASV